MSLYSFRYIQDDDPSGDVDFEGAGFEWYSPSTGDLYIRDTTNTTWNLIGNGDLTTLGNLARNGGVMTGAITGVTGWAPLDSPDFATSAKRDGINLATVNDLSTLQTTLETLISAQIASGMAGLSASISLDNSIAWGMGTINHGGTIPLPSFSDRQATHSEIVLMLPSVNAFGQSDDSGTTNTVACTINSGSRLVTLTNTNGHTGVDSAGGNIVNYIIVCKKASS